MTIERIKPVRTRYERRAKETNVYTQPGDSGGPVFSVNRDGTINLLGVTSSITGIIPEANYLPWSGITYDFGQQGYSSGVAPMNSAGTASQTINLNLLAGSGFCPSLAFLRSPRSQKPSVSMLSSRLSAFSRTDHAYPTSPDQSGGYSEILAPGEVFSDYAGATPENVLSLCLRPSDRKDQPCTSNLPEILKTTP